MAEVPVSLPTQRVQARLDAFASQVEGVRNAVVASVDGFDIAQAGTGGNAERLAAMTSSMLGLARAVGRELALGELEVLIVEASHGKVLMLSVPLRPQPVLLMAACDARALTGTVLWRARECAQQILQDTGGS